MSEITRHLSYNDIKMLRKNSGGRQKKAEERNWQEQILGREIQE